MNKYLAYTVIWVNAMNRYLQRFVLSMNNVDFTRSMQQADVDTSDLFTQSLVLCGKSSKILSNSIPLT